MKKFKPVYFTVFISILTLIFSFYVAWDITGSLFSRVRIIQLESYGGITLDHLKNLEVWRLFASQIIHVKQFHMLFNVISIFVLGIFIERHIGFFRMFFLWFLAGSFGTVFSTLFVPAPWNLGTGASQAILGISAFGIILTYQKIDVSRGLKYALLFAIVPALLLDLIFAHYPKPGHISAFIVGWIIGLFYLKEIKNDSKKELSATSSS